ncbi:ferredoxin--NADP reductase [Nocardia pseudovaccinii]|uniref:ferredoxin--NADP reductase n=1 Tax=Nocardia pseudovaccinii TaxID=189540 RepID=UPI0007A38D61|nr:ferredoxin--NADP reductase [Nocardia pseudovaccinii]
MSAAVTFRVVRVTAETQDAVSLELVAEPEGHLSYRPGQFLTLRIPSERTGSVARSYSLSSAPHEGRLAVTVKRTAGGYASNWLCDNAVPGMTIDSLPPAGIFTPDSLDADLLLLAAGSGITPMLSILKSVLAQGTGRCTLIYANRDEESVIFADELRSLTAEHPHRLVVLHWLEAVQGLPSVPTLTTLITPWTGRELFVCGPAPFMDAVVTAADNLGMDRVHVEKFVSISGDPFAETEVEDTDDAAIVEVELDGATNEFAWPRNTVLLDVLLARGMAAPYSCREGACSACVCRVVDGEVKLLRNEVLERADLADGYVLACQAVPVTDAVRVTYE